MNSKDTDDKTPMMQIGRIEINQKDFGLAPDTDGLPLLATRNLVLFPGVTIPISLGRESSLRVAREASENHIPVGIVCQRNPEEEKPSMMRGLFRYGTVADIYQVIELPDGTYTALVQGRERFKILGKGADCVIDDVMSAKVELLPDIAAKSPVEYDTAVKTITEIASEISTMQSGGDNGFANAIKGLEDSDAVVNFIATNFPFTVENKIDLLKVDNMSKRAIDLLAMIMTERERLSVAQDIMEKAGRRMKDNQRSVYLQMQLDTIKDELYGGPDETDDFEKLEEMAAKAHMPQAVHDVFHSELNKLRRLNPSTPDYSVQYSYLETLVSLPWRPEKLTSNIKKARTTLENDHYGLEKIKQRILEQIAVVINNPKAKSPILCLVGPPGVGKTSLGQSIAKAMGRKYQRVSLGGVHDESEIRGHRRTYIGAMPGRIIKAMKSAKTTNPVLLLDEIDKIGSDYKGDPAAALLEVLDPEQNATFHDNYIDVDYDLSNVFFIATANTLSTVAAPLIDRMEVIDLSGYIIEEKIEIARRHLIPKVLKANGLTADFGFDLSNETLTAIIEKYTAESGVRQLEKKIATLVRKAILASLGDDEFPAEIKPSDLEKLLGLPLYNKDKYEGNDYPGVVTGLAWTQVGGEILLAEASLSPGKGDRLTITGNLGDVMKESATIALQWVKANSARLGIDPARFEQNNLHIHFPEGAIPKDGPSAGITIATAITSIFTGRKVAPRLAMTGEITLRGKVLPVGGIKEKILAAKRAGIDTIVLSAENRRDIEDIPEKYRDGLNFKYVNNVDEVIDIALVNQ